MLCCEERSWWQAEVQESGTVLTAGTVPGTSRRARRFGMQLPIYSVKLDRGSVVSITGNTRIQKIESDDDVKDAPIGAG